LTRHYAEAKGIQRQHCSRHNDSSSSSCGSGIVSDGVLAVEAAARSRQSSAHAREEHTSELQQMKLNFSGAGPDAKWGLPCQNMSMGACAQMERERLHYESMQRAQLAEITSRVAMNYATANQMRRPW
jgi:hypothetical protein